MFGSSQKLSDGNYKLENVVSAPVIDNSILGQEVGFLLISHFVLHPSVKLCHFPQDDHVFLLRNCLCDSVKVVLKAWKVGAKISVIC